MVVTYLLTFLLSFFLSLYGTPLARNAALRYGIIDKPDGKLKTQVAPVPYLGGLAVFLSFLLSCGLVYEFSKEVLGLLLAQSLIVLLGLIDDFGVLSARNKLIGQLIACFILIKAGIMIKIEFLPYWLAALFSILWILAITNGFNLIDVMDGLSTGIAFFCSVFFFIIAQVNDRPMIAVLTIALAGSLLGFLKYNFDPAKIYLGDTGSMFIGLTLGSLALIGSYSEINKLGYLTPLVILGLPIFDTCLVSYIRFIRGHSIFIGSSDHFALRLRKWALTKRQTVIASYGVTIMLGIVGLFMIFTTSYNSLIILFSVILAFLLVALFLKQIDMGL
jgi:UDP-GlcNAc:undecaprenyl-phosphate GlcNAc-1-phosphate transferase